MSQRESHIVGRRFMKADLYLHPDGEWKTETCRALRVSESTLNAVLSAVKFAHMADRRGQEWDVVGRPAAEAESSGHPWID